MTTREGGVLSVLVSNPKGGSGKTTVATNLAAAFAAAGRRTTLADVDRQRSSLRWLDRRPASAPPIQGLDWVRDQDKAPKQADVLIIDAPAAIRSKKTDNLVARADLVVVPVLPSSFDQDTTSRFLKRLDELKPIRKNRKPVVIVGNRVRRNSRAAARLDIFLFGLGGRDLGWLPDRAAYSELAGQGLSIFDLTSKRGEDLRQDWQSLLRFIQAAR